MSILLFNTNSFDSSIIKDFYFKSEGFQVFANRLVIKNAETNIEVYNQLQNSMKMNHTVPANILTNGICYTAQIKVYDKDNNESPLSNNISFYCYSTPQFGFSNLVQNQILSVSNYEVKIDYSQSEGELLDEYYLTLSDSTHQEIWKSPLLYNNNLSVSLNYLEDGQGYYLKAFGKTLTDMEIVSEEIFFSVKYKTPSLYSLVYLENDRLHKNIRIRLNMLPIDGKTNPVEAVYIDNKYIDLRADESYVLYDEGFEFKDVFTVQFIGKVFKKQSRILLMKDGNKKIELFWRKGTFKNDTTEKYYVWLKITDRSSIYIGSSQLLTINNLEADFISIWLRKQNNLYDIKAEVRTVI